MIGVPAARRERRRPAILRPLRWAGQPSGLPCRPRPRAAEVLPGLRAGAGRPGHADGMVGPVLPARPAGKPWLGL